MVTIETATTILTQIERDISYIPKAEQIMKENNALTIDHLVLIRSGGTLSLFSLINLIAMIIILYFTGFEHKIISGVVISIAVAIYVFINFALHKHWPIRRKFIRDYFIKYT